MPDLLDPHAVIDISESRFGETDRADLAGLFAAAAASGRDTLALWFHGGLVGRKLALASVAGWREAVEPEAWPAVVVWDSGLGHTITRNLDTIAADLVHSRLAGAVLKVLAKKVFAGGLAGPAAEPTEAEDLAALQAAVAQDEELGRALDGAARTSPSGLAPRSLLSPALLDELRTSKTQPAGLGLPGWVVTTAKFLLVVVRAVRRRRAAEPDRPLGATVSEEVLRTVYVDALGGAVWGAMKGDTKDAFDGADAPGTALVEELAGWFAGGPNRRVVCVGHSTGAVFICHLLRAAAGRMPAGAAFELVFLAAAATFDLVHETLATPGVPALVKRLDSYGLSDLRERGYWEVPGLYPASLLYLVSGLFEPAPDTPLVGMERYWDEARYPAGTPLAEARAAIAAVGARLTWAPALGHPPAESDAVSHGGLDGDGATLRSLRHLLARDLPAAGGLTAPADAAAPAGLAAPGGLAAPAGLTAPAGLAGPCDNVRAWQSSGHSAPITRRPPQAHPGTGQLRAAAVQVDLTPELFRTTTGYGATKAERGKGWLGRNRATLALLEGADGARVLLVAADLHVGSRWLTEALGHSLAPIGISVDRVVMGATHTHSGPGGFYAVPFYDRFAGAVSAGLFDGFDVPGSHALVDTLVTAARGLPARLVPARVSLGRAEALGTLWNRSRLAFLANFGEPGGTDEATKVERTAAWAAAAHGLDPARARAAEAKERGAAAVDPYIRVLWLQGQGGAPLAAFAWLGATPTLNPNHVGLFSSDVAGAAARHAERALRAEGVEVPVGVLGGALGDVNVIHPALSLDTLRALRAEGTSGDVGTRRVLATRVVRSAGAALGEHLADAVRAARAAPAEPVRLEVRYAEVVVPGASVVEDGVTRRMSCRWWPGESTTAASELNKDPPTPGAPVKGVVERTQRNPDGPALQPFDPADPHSPKADTLDLPGILPVVSRPFLDGWGAGGFDPWAPLRVVTVGSLRLVTVPAEPSAAWTAALAGALGGEVLVCANAGGYQGYVATRAEYVVQDYEGSSVFWGRNYGALLHQELLRLAAGPATAPGAGLDEKAWFVWNEAALADEEDDDDGVAGGLGAPVGISVRPWTRPELPEPQTLGIFAFWRPDTRPKRRTDTRRGRPNPADGALFTLMAEEGGGWVPVRWNGRPVDDVNGEMAVWWERGAWHAYVEIPRALVAGKRLSFAVREEPEVRPAHVALPGAVTVSVPA